MIKFLRTVDRYLRVYRVLWYAPDGRTLDPRRYWTRSGAQRAANRYERQHETANRAAGYRYFRARVLHRVTDAPLRNPWRGGRYHTPMWER